MAIASLEGLLERGIITLPQHQAALAAESSLSPVAWERDFRGGAREISDSAMRTHLGYLEYKLVHKKTTFENYWKWVTGVFDRARAAVYSSLPQQEDGWVRQSQGESEQDQGESSQKVQKSGDKSVVKSVVAGESVSAAVVIKSEVSQVKKTKAEEMSEGVVESDVAHEESLSEGQSAKKELGRSNAKRKGSKHRAKAEYWNYAKVY